MTSYLSAPIGYKSSELVFNDSFLGKTLNNRTWNTYITAKAFGGAPWYGTPGGGSGLDSSENAAYFEPSQVSVDDGLNLTAVDDPISALGMNYSYTSGAVSTYGKFEFDGGYLQISMKEPAGDGAWPAIWLLPGATSTAGDYEIDVQEGGMGSDPVTGVNYCLHNNYSQYAGGNTNIGENLTAGYHTYGIDWEPGVSITWYLDGLQVGKVVQGEMAYDNATSAYAPINIPDTPMFLMIDLQMATAGDASWHSTPDSSTPASMDLQVADVQLYQHAGETVTGSNVASFSGGGQNINLDSAPANSVILSNTNGTSDAVSGSNGQVTMFSAQASVVGGADTVVTDGSSSDNLSLVNTNRAWDLVEGSNTSVTVSNAQTSLVGNGDTVSLDTSESDVVSLYNTNGTWNSVWGSNAIVNFTNAQSSLIGGNNLVYTDNSSADIISLYNTGGGWDTVSALNATVDVTNAQTSVVGGNNKIYTDNSSADIVSMYYTGSAADSVSESNGTLNMTNSQSYLFGNDDAVYTGGSNVLAVSGSNETFHFGSVSGAENLFGYVSSSDQIYLAASQFGPSFAAFGADISQSGANTVISDHAGDLITLFGVNATSLVAANFHFT